MTQQPPLTNTPDQEDDCTASTRLLHLRIFKASSLVI
jgi:hypothetical protein